MDYSTDDESQSSSEEESLFWNEPQPQRNDGNPQKDEFIQLSESTFLHPNRKLTPRGNVYEGEFRCAVHNDRPCVVKVAVAERSEEYAREARILRKLDSHTFVITILESGVYKDLFEDHVYIALEKCWKKNLRQHFKDRKESGLVYDVNTGLFYCEQIIIGLKYVHENLIFHKDLKPSNILLSLPYGEIKLADFGFSQELKSTSSKVFCNHQFGTNGFRPPESFGNSWASLKSDIYSLGALFYFIMSNGMSHLGDDFHLWTHNTQNGVFDTSHLLVKNPKTTEHLIKSMLSQERCRRPSIWEVDDHACWTGNEVDWKGNFEYGYHEEVDECDVETSVSQNKKSEVSETQVERDRDFLGAADIMEYGSIPCPETSIIIFDWESKHLQLFNPRNETVIQTHKFSDKMRQSYRFTSICIGDYIYVLTKRSMQRLKHYGVTTTWEEMPDLIEDHGIYPPAVAASEWIIVAGTGEADSTKSVTKYDVSMNRWEKLKDKQISTSESSNVILRGFVYCVGGWITAVGPTKRVERLNVVTQSWHEVASMREARYAASAVECYGKLIIVGGVNADSVEKYDPGVNQWTIMKPMSVLGHGSTFRCHFIDGHIYAVGDYNNAIEKYSFKKDEWKVVELPDNVALDVRSSVAV